MLLWARLTRPHSLKIVYAPHVSCSLSRCLGLGSATLAAPASGFLSPAQLKAALTARASGQQKFTLINVHIPYEGRIAGTDLLLPYDTIGQNRALPADKRARSSCTAARAT